MWNTYRAVDETEQPSMISPPTSPPTTEPTPSPTTDAPTSSPTTDAPTSPPTTEPTPSPLVCGDSLSETYLTKIREANIDLYAPSAYFRGGATKFISSSGETQLNSDKLCVDGATSYTGPIQLYDDGSHGDDVANDGVYSRE